MEDKKIYEGDSATGYKITIGNCVFTVNEATARRNGSIKGAIDDYSSCCNQKLPR